MEHTAAATESSSLFKVDIGSNENAPQNSQPPSYLDIFRSYPTNAKIAYGLSHAANGAAIVTFIPVIPLMGSCWNFTGGCVPGYVLLTAALALSVAGQLANNVGNEIMAYNKKAG